MMKVISVKRTTLIIMAFTFLSYLLGFARESYIAYKFGATGLTDSFYIAAVVPEMAAGLITNALTNAFVPILKKEMHGPTGSPQRLIDIVVMHAAILSVLLMGAGYLFRGTIIHLLAPGFSHEQYIYAMHLLSIMMISVVFSALSGILWGVYNAHERYLFPALIGVVSNSVMLITIALFAKYLGIESLAYGLTLGMSGRFLVQFIPLIKARQLHIPRAIWHPAIREIAYLIPPTLISTGLASLNLIVDRVLASSLPGGQLTDLNFASKLGFLPMGLIGASIATTLYTRFVTHTLDNQEGKLQSILQTSMTWVTFLGMFIGFIFNFFGIDIVALLYHHGAFSYKNVLITAQPLRAYGWFLVFYLMQPILVRFFYARHDNKYIMLSALCAVTVNIAVSVLLVHPLGVLGLALGNCASNVTLNVFLFVVISRILHWNVLRMIRRALTLSIPPAGAFVLGCLIISAIWSQAHTAPIFWRLIRDVVAGLMGIGCLLLATRVSKKSILTGVFWR